MVGDGSVTDNLGDRIRARRDAAIAAAKESLGTELHDKLDKLLESHAELHAKLDRLNGE